MVKERDKLEPIVEAADCPMCPCCGQERYCRKHEAHYADCPCIGPHDAEERGYEIIQIRGRSYARKRKGVPEG